MGMSAWKHVANISHEKSMVIDLNQSVSASLSRHIRRQLLGEAATRKDDLHQVGMKPLA